MNLDLSANILLSVLFLVAVIPAVIAWVIPIRVKKTAEPSKPDVRYFTHISTGRLYVRNGIAISATNATSGQHLILYHSVQNPGTMYAREESEFLEKFKETPKNHHLPRRLPQ